MLSTEILKHSTLKQETLILHSVQREYLQDSKLNDALVTSASNLMRLSLALSLFFFGGGVSKGINYILEVSPNGANFLSIL